MKQKLLRLLFAFVTTSLVFGSYYGGRAYFYSQAPEKESVAARAKRMLRYYRKDCPTVKQVERHEGELDVECDNGKRYFIYVDMPCSESRWCELFGIWCWHVEPGR